MKYRKPPCEFTEMAEGGEDSALLVRPVQVTGCIYHLNSEKPTSKWSFLMKLEPDFNLMVGKLKIACNIKERCLDVGINDFKLKLYCR